MSIPARTNRLHLDPYWLGDSPRAISKAGTKGSRGGSPYIDLNLQHTLDGDVVMHWGTARKGGWRYIVRTDGKRRKLTVGELDRPLTKWRTADVDRWRQTKFRSLTYRSRVHPIRFGTALDLCKTHGAVACFELKSTAYEKATLARVLVDAVQAHKTTAWFMTLVVMPGWRDKARAFHDAGSPIALLPHGAPRPLDLDKFYSRDGSGIVGAIWGRFK